mmetsp:Transcript_7087/g.10815  ORF Transcript_7087/g.10815 Transcript_7087/m.10815 type:complete len:317 (+) Transcript_7087:27-977(+)
MIMSLQPVQKFHKIHICMILFIGTWILYHPRTQHICTKLLVIYSCQFATAITIMIKYLPEDGKVSLLHAIGQTPIILVTDGRGRIREENKLHIPRIHEFHFAPMLLFDSSPQHIHHQLFKWTEPLNLRMIFWKTTNLEITNLQHHISCPNSCIISRPVLLHPHNTEASRVALGVVPIYHLAAQPSPELCQPLLVCFDLPVSLGPILVHKRNFPLAPKIFSRIAACVAWWHRRHNHIFVFWRRRPYFWHRRRSVRENQFSLGLPQIRTFSAWRTATQFAVKLQRVHKESTLPLTLLMSLRQHVDLFDDSVWHHIVQP